MEALAKIAILAVAPEPFDVIVFSLVILLTFAGLIALLLIGIYVDRHRTSPSPYTGLPLRRAEDIPYFSKERILRYLYNYHEYDNRILSFKKSSFCRDTGRIFQNSVNLLGMIKVDWNFLSHRHPGKYVSWGSLGMAQKRYIMERHHSLEGFQTEYSSPEPAPKNISREFSYYSPGPLYVDLDTNILLGWKIVPETEFEVLIVQHPIKPREITLPNSENL